MPRPSSGLEEYQDLIQRWYITDQLTINQLTDKIILELRIRVTDRTVRRYLRQWGATKERHIPIGEPSAELMADIREIWFERACRNDRDLARALRLRGWQLHKAAITQYRRRIIGPMRIQRIDQEDEDARAREAVRGELDGGDANYGREQFRTHMRQQGHHFSSLYTRSYVV
jgi:hypothetical protein